MGLTLGFSCLSLPECWNYRNCPGLWLFFFKKWCSHRLQLIINEYGISDTGWIRVNVPIANFGFFTCSVLHNIAILRIWKQVIQERKIKPLGFIWKRKEGKKKHNRHPTWCPGNWRKKSSHLEGFRLCFQISRCYGLIQHDSWDDRAKVNVGIIFL